jgi:hypothetical protein
MLGCPGIVRSRSYEVHNTVDVGFGSWSTGRGGVWSMARLWSWLSMFVTYSKRDATLFPYITLSYRSLSLYIASKLHSQCMLHSFCMLLPELDVLLVPIAP